MHKILFVDDETDFKPLVLQKFSPQLKSGAYQLFFAADEEEALNIIENHPDMSLVICEMNMPGVNDQTFLKHINDKYPQIKSVVLFAYENMEKIRQAMNHGAFDFMTKPINFEDLERTITKTLEHSKKCRKDLFARDQLILLNHEMDVATCFQQSILPKHFPKDIRFQLHGEVIPSIEVGGDFYDFFYLDENRLGLIIADVSGKGVMPGFFISRTRTYLRAAASYCSTPKEAIEKLNTFLCQDNETKTFVTLFYGVFDCQTGEMHYVSARHCKPAIVNTQGQVELLPLIEGMALGIEEECIFEEAATKLSPGETVVMYTKGIIDATNPQGEEYSIGRLFLTLSENHCAPAFLISQKIIENIKLFIGNEKQHDDMTLFALKYLGN